MSATVPVDLYDAVAALALEGECTMVSVVRTLLTEAIAARAAKAAPASVPADADTPVLCHGEDAP